MSFEEIMQRIVNTEVKANLKSSIMIRDSNICCLRNYCFSNIIISKVQTQTTIAKNSHFEKLKAKNRKLTKADKLFKQACKKKKRKSIMKSGIKKSRPRLVPPMLLKSRRRKKRKKSRF